MPATIIYQFPFLPANGSNSVFIHGYSDQEAVNYSALVFPHVFGGGPGGPVIMTQEENFRHVDGTAARIVRVHNLDPRNDMSVNILQVSEQF